MMKRRILFSLLFASFISLPVTKVFSMKKPIVFSKELIDAYEIIDPKVARKIREKRTGLCLAPLPTHLSPCPLSFVRKYTDWLEGEEGAWRKYAGDDMKGISPDFSDPVKAKAFAQAHAKHIRSLDGE